MTEHRAIPYTEVRKGDTILVTTKYTAYEYAEITDMVNGCIRFQGGTEWINLMRGGTINIYLVDRPEVAPVNGDRFKSGDSNWVYMHGWLYQEPTDFSSDVQYNKGGPVYAYEWDKFKDQFKKVEESV